MDHFIDVSFDLDPTDPNVVVVTATPNPLPARGLDPPSPRIEVKPGDTVIWRFNPKNVEGKNLEVKFKAVLDLTIAGSKRQPLAHPGPFSSLTTSSNQVQGSIHSTVPQDIGASKRFIYDILVNGARATWAGAFIDGGIDIPRTPP